MTTKIKMKTVKKAGKPVTNTELKEIQSSLGIPNTQPVSVKDATLAVFKATPDKEFKTDEVVKTVQASLPKVKRDTILWTVTELKKSGVIVRVRNEGHTHILKLGSGSGVAPMAVASISTKTIASPKASPDALGGALVKLNTLVEQREKIDLQITLVKAQISELVSVI